MFATVGSESYIYRKLKFLRLPENGAPAAVLNKKGATLPRKVPRPIAILLTTLLFVALGPFLWLPREKAFTSKGKSFHLQRDCQHIVGKKLPTFYCCKSCMKQFPSTSEKDEWRWITGRKPYKMALGKRQLTLRLDEIDALQNGSGLFKLFIRPWLHWFDHFLTKLSKWLWIKIIIIIQCSWQAVPFCRARVYGHTILENGRHNMPQPFCRAKS